MKRRSDMYSFFNIYHVKSNCRINSLELFSLIFSCWIIFILFQLYLFIKGLIFDILYKFLPISSWFNATVAAYWKHLLSSLKGFIVACFFFNPIMRIYNWSTTFQIYFTTFAMQKINTIKDKITTINLMFMFDIY